MALRGQFSKPRYSAVDSERCALTARGVAGCSRCLSVCPSGALRVHGEGAAAKVTLDAHLCQGSGQCASLCPTGAISYHAPEAWPFAHAPLTAGAPFYVVETALADDLAALLAAAPMAHLAHASQACVLALEEPGRLSLAHGLSALAAGASAVRWISATPERLQRELAPALAEAEHLLSAAGYPLAASALRVLAITDAATIYADATALDQAARHALALHRSALSAGAPLPEPADAAPRAARISWAIDTLAARYQTPPQAAALPAGLPYGAVHIDSERCTACMGCVAICPSQALSCRGEVPVIDFCESDCHQCGLCQRACPEQAISLIARWQGDRTARQQKRSVHSAAAAVCPQCQTPFAPAATISRLQQQLADHPYFQGAQARHLTLCADCRVQALFAAPAPNAL
ncbi:MAG: 4Fe-4S dicluster domain-containing protein [Aeromonas sp.]